MLEQGDWMHNQMIEDGFALHEIMHLMYEGGERDPAFLDYLLELDKEWERLQNASSSPGA